MKHVLTFCAILALSSIMLYTQTKDPAPREVQEVPQLQEWWRADNMGYGTEGMTWLDNFYNGKGALVISTPNGVQTWLLQYPWDTVNVFTWQGGNANIKTGDFNGDGIKDYVDANRKIYLGKKNGEPPQEQFIQPTIPLSPHMVHDFNGDGYTDVFSGGIFLLGGNDVSAMQRVNIQPSSSVDSNTHFLGFYTTPNGAVRFLCSYSYSQFNQQTMNYDYDFDGYVLLEMQWSAGSTEPSFKVLDKQIIQREALVRLVQIQQSDKVYLIAGEFAFGFKEYLKNNLVIYNLSNDKIEKVSSTRMDGISSIQSLNHSIDGDSIKDWYIQRTTGSTSEYFNIYSGKIGDSLSSILNINPCIASKPISLSITNGKPTLATIGGYKDVWTNKFISCFTLYNLVTTSVNDENANSPIFIVERELNSVNSPISVRINVPNACNAEIKLFGINQRLLFHETNINISQNEFSFDIPTKGLGRGLYTVQAILGGRSFLKNIIID